MNRATRFALVGCLGAAGVLSCSTKEPVKEPPGSKIGGAAAQDVPDIPVDVMPKLLQAPVDYPEEARNRGEEGIVYVKALVGKDGKVSQATVDPEKPSSATLGKAAVDAVTRWTFEPARSKGEPVSVWIVVPVNYRLK